MSVFDTDGNAVIPTKNGFCIGYYGGENSSGTHIHETHLVHIDEIASHDPTRWTYATLKREHVDAETRKAGM